MSDMSADRQFKQDLMRLCQHLQTMKRELASIRHPKDRKAHFDAMSDQLDEVIGATESATNTLLESLEEIGEIANDLRAEVSGDEASSRIDRIEELIAESFQACSFQDITGQRVTKIVSSMQFIDESITAMAAFWGDDDLASVEVREVEEDEEAALLQGPQSDGEGVSQDEIDALFG